MKKLMQYLLGYTRSLFAFLLLATMLFSKPAKATVEPDASWCYYTVNGITYIEVYGGASYNGWHNSEAPYDTRIRLEVTAGGVFLGSFYSVTGAGSFIYNIGTVPGPYCIKYIYEALDASGNVVAHEDYGATGCMPVDKICDFGMPQDDSANACFYIQKTEQGTNTVATFNVSQETMLYASSQGYNVAQLNVSDGTNNYTVTISPFSPSTTTSFNLNALGFNLQYGNCYTVSLYMYNSNNPGNGYNTLDIEMCTCENPPCSAEFSTVINLGGSASTFALDMLGTYSGAISSQSYIIDGPGIHIVTNGMSSIILPYGTYTVCHTVIKEDGDRCRVCKTVCYSYSESEGGHGGGTSGKSRPVSKPTIVKDGYINSYSLFPNPTSDDATVRISLAQDTKVAVDVLDATGRVVMNVPAQSMTTGTHSVSIFTSGLASGIYNVRITTAGGATTQRLNVVR